MSNMKCPFCQQKLDYDDLLGSCINEHCEESFDMVGTESLWQKVINLKQELDRTRKENEDKQAVLNCVVDMLKTLNQRYALIMGKDVIKETVRLLEQTKGGDNE